MALHGGKTVPPDFRAKNDKELYGDSQVEMLNIYLRNAPQVGRRDWSSVWTALRSCQERANKYASY